MVSIVRKMLLILLAVLIFAPSASAFSLNIFGFGSQSVLCESTEDLTALADKYNGVAYSDKVSGFVNETGYDRIGFIIVDDGVDCMYHYTVLLADDRILYVSSGIDGVDFNATIDYDAVFDAEAAYESHDALALLIAAIDVEMPYDVYYRVIRFLASYV